MFVIFFFDLGRLSILIYSQYLLLVSEKVSYIPPLRLGQSLRPFNEDFSLRVVLDLPSDPSLIVPSSFFSLVTEDSLYGTSVKKG